MRRRQKLTGEHLAAFDAAIYWEALGSEVASGSQEQSGSDSRSTQETALLS
jgi:hypothetical protein